MIARKAKNRRRDCRITGEPGRPPDQNPVLTIGGPTGTGLPRRDRRFSGRCISRPIQPARGQKIQLRDAGNCVINYGRIFLCRPVSVGAMPRPRMGNQSIHGHQTRRARGTYPWQGGRFRMIGAMSYTSRGQPAGIGSGLLKIMGREGPDRRSAVRTGPQERLQETGPRGRFEMIAEWTKHHGQASTVIAKRLGEQGISGRRPFMDHDGGLSKTTRSSNRRENLSSRSSIRLRGDFKDGRGWPVQDERLESADHCSTLCSAPIYRGLFIGSLLGLSKEEIAVLRKRAGPSENSGPGRGNPGERARIGIDARSGFRFWLRVERRPRAHS